MQGAVAQAEMLYRQGYDSWHWGDDALLRAATYLFALARRTGQEDWNAPAGHGWIPWLLNARYGASFPTRSPAGPGKGLGFTDWTAAAQRGDTANGAGLAVAPVDAVKPPPSSLDRAARDAVPIVLAAGGGLVLLLLVVHLVRRRGPRRPGPSGTSAQARRPS
jgi:hypothetical protein